MKYIYELSLKQYEKYWALATKRSKGIITDKEFKKQLNKIIND